MVETDSNIDPNIVVAASLSMFLIYVQDWVSVLL
jgi:hypothetical protein